MSWGLCSSLFHIWRLYKKRKKIKHTCCMLFRLRMKTLKVTLSVDCLCCIANQKKKNLSWGMSFSNCLYLLLSWIYMYGVNKSVVLCRTTSLFVVIHLVYSLKREQLINTSNMVQSHVSTGRQSAFVFNILSCLVFRAWRRTWYKGIGSLFYWLTQPFNSVPSRHQRLQ